MQNKTTNVKLNSQETTMLIQYIVIPQVICCDFDLNITIQSVSEVLPDLDYFLND